MPGVPFKDDQIEEMLKRMRDGETLTSIAADSRMPSIDTMNRWEAEQDDRGTAITRARMDGYTTRAEKALAEAETCEDAALGRLSFDANRWFLGKMHPKKFGDATLLKHGDADGEKFDLSEVIAAGRARLVKARDGDEV